MKTPTKPESGWGILNPDEALEPETIAILQSLSKLTPGQRDAILIRGVHRHLVVEMDLGNDPKPTKSNMVLCSNSLSNTWFDFLGHP